MDHEIIIKLLKNIKAKANVGVASVEAVDYCIQNDLLERTRLGNFKLSQKGEDLLNGDIALAT